MKKIQLSGKKSFGYFMLVDSGDYDFIIQWKWKLGRDGYARRTAKNGVGWKNIKVHRLLLNAPIGVMVDHKNGNKLDNRRSNLRFCNKSQNTQNCPPRKNLKYGYKGIYKKRENYFVASIQLNGNRINRYGFRTPEEAAVGYNELAQKYFGEFANINIDIKMIDGHSPIPY